MGLTDLVKPTRIIVATFIVLFIIFGLLVFYIGYSVMIVCMCPATGPCDCTLDTNERVGYGIDALIGINTHIYIVPILVLLYLISCGLVGVVHRLRK
jgi:hypothetical protein